VWECWDLISLNFTVCAPTLPLMGISCRFESLLQCAKEFQEYQPSGVSNEQLQPNCKLVLFILSLQIGDYVV
jgi:hypothetical protein